MVGCHSGFFCEDPCEMVWTDIRLFCKCSQREGFMKVFIYIGDGIRNRGSAKGASLFALPGKEKTV